MAHNNIRKVLMFVAAIATFMGLAMYASAEYDEFSCIAGTHRIKTGDTVYGVARQYCSGNYSNAVQYIMDSNGIAGTELTSLRVGTSIQVIASK